MGSDMEKIALLSISTSRHLCRTDAAARVHMQQMEDATVVRRRSEEEGTAAVGESVTRFVTRSLIRCVIRFVRQSISQISRISAT